jgi:hypothetical protein
MPPRRSDPLPGLEPVGLIFPQYRDHHDTTRWDGDFFALGADPTRRTPVTSLETAEVIGAGETSRG